MNNNHKIYHNDEINLKELFSVLYYNKLYILFFSFLFFFLASIYLQSAEKRYTVVHKLKPVIETQQRNSLSGLGGFAALSGINLPSKNSNDFTIFKELILSVEVAERVFENKELIKNIYSNEWNESLNSFSGPQKNKTMVHIDKFIKTLTGNNDLIYKPPNAKRLSSYISEKIQITEDKDTGYLTIKAETSKPEVLLSLIVKLSELSDKVMRQRYIDFAKEPLSFYKEKLRISRSRELRETLAKLIGDEEQKLMFASRGKYFIAEPYINPSISLYPTAPKPALVLFSALIFGLITGVVVIQVRNTIVKDV